jgi:hypothetical protein
MENNLSDQPIDVAALHACPGGLLGIALHAGAHRLIALRTLAAGQGVLTVDGTLTSQPTRYSLQVGPDLHVAPVPGNLDDGYWRYLNHSCEPNAGLRGRELVAQRDIAANEDVTFDYNTTEWHMAEPFACHCGSARCRGTLRGFAHLSTAQRAELQGVAPHLQARLALTTA